MKYLWLSALILPALVLMLPHSARADACYGAAEQEAEQLVRLHSQLMVITLSCRTTDSGVPLPPAYQKFTRTYLEDIKAAERALMGWHRGQGGKGEARLDRIRTDFGNQYSRQLAAMSPQGFCAAYRNYVVKAASLTRPQLAATLQDMKADYRGKVPACGIKQAAK